MATGEEHGSTATFLHRVEFPDDARQPTVCLVVVQIIGMRVTGKVEHPTATVWLESVMSVRTNG